MSDKTDTEVLDVAELPVLHISPTAKHLESGKWFTYPALHGERFEFEVMLRRHDNQAALKHTAAELKRYGFGPEDAISVAQSNELTARSYALDVLGWKHPIYEFSYDNVCALMRGVAHFRDWVMKTADDDTEWVSKAVGNSPSGDAQASTEIKSAATG